jgi:hypothetical protein
MISLNKGLRWPDSMMMGANGQGLSPAIVLLQSSWTLKLKFIEEVCSNTT